MRRRAAVLVPAALLLAALVGCEATPARRSAAPGTDTRTATAAPSAAGTGSTGTAVGTAAGATAGPPAVQPAYHSERPPAESPGRLAEATASGAGGWIARLWFGGVPVDRAAGRPVVAYAAVELDSDSTGIVAHTKLALFHCQRREAAGSPNFLGCAGRQVEYGDLARSQLQVHRTGGGAFTMSGSFPTYTYGGVDRGVGLPVRWTGRTFAVRVSCAPDPEPVCRPGRPGRSAASAAVTLGGDPRAGRAGLDFGYLNRLTR